MEIYLGASMAILAEIIGLGPAENEKFAAYLGFVKRENYLPPLVVQTECGEVFVCEFNSGEFQDSPDGVKFEKSYITPQDFQKTNMEYLLGRLLKDKKQIHFNLGESWDEERFFSWRSEVPDYINSLSKDILSTAITLTDGYEIARRMELLYELELFERIYRNTKEDEIYTDWKSGRKDSLEIIYKQIPWLYQKEIDKNKNVGFSNKKPSLDFYDKS
jgi:hypothetical protein